MGNVLEKGQKVFIIDGLGSALDDFILVRRESIRSVEAPNCFTVYASRRVYSIGKNAYLLKIDAYEKALRMQTVRLVMQSEKRKEHLTQWEIFLQEFGHEMPAIWTRKNFTSDEFECEDCKLRNMDRWFIERLQLSRTIAAIPYNINSGWRCPTWNAKVGGSDDSSHLLGLAADISAVTSQERFIIVGALIQAGFMRIGIGEDFIHIDADPDKTQGVIWLY